MNPVAALHLRTLAEMAEDLNTWNAAWTRMERDRAGDPEWLAQVGVAYEATIGTMREALPLLRQGRVFDLSRDAYNAAMARAASGELVGVPDLARLPFDVCVFGCQENGAPVDILDVLDSRVARKVSRGCEDADVGTYECALLAVSRWGGLYLLSPASASLSQHSIPVRWTVNVLAVVTEEGWDPSAIPWMWALTLLADLVRTRARPERQTSLAARRWMTRAQQAGARPAPVELYELHLDRRRAGHAIGALARPHAAPSYRHEVMGHERLLLHRGRWPLGELAEHWAARGYEVTRGDRLPQDLRERMAARGIAPGLASEWVAWRVVQVREHERGPEGAPVVRAVRVGGLSRPEER